MIQELESKDGMQMQVKGKGEEELVFLWSGDHIEQPTSARGLLNVGKADPAR